MITLAIDTSAHLCAAALHDDGIGAVLAECSEDIGRGHAERLMETIGHVLAETGLAYSDIGRVAACVGPGSFTGVRVGLATARGMALGLGVPVLGVSALDALKLAASEKEGEGETPLLVVLDARRGEVYAQFFGDNSGTFPEGPFVASCETIATMAADANNLALCGSGAPLIAEQAGREFEIRHRLAAAPIGDYARLGAGAPLTQTRPEPLYLRPPDAKPQTGFALARA